MQVTHELCKCIDCNEILEITDEDRREGDVVCLACGCINELRDSRLKIWLEDY